MNKLLKFIAISMLLLVTFTVTKSFAQAKKKKPASARETERKLRHSRDSVIQALSKTDTSINSRLQRVEQYIGTYTQINNSLDEGLDTADVSDQLPGVTKRLAKIQDLLNAKKSSTLRYLFVLRDNLDRIQDQLDGWQSDMDDLNTKLIQNQHDIIRFTDDPLIKNLPENALLKTTFSQQVKTVRGLWHEADSTNRNDLLKVNLLQDKIAGAYTRILDETDQIDTKIKKFAVRAADGEFGFIWEAPPKYSSLESALAATISLNSTQVHYFLKNGTAVHLFGLLFFILIASWIFYNWNKIIRSNDRHETIHDHVNYIYKKPLISSLLITASLVPYFYNRPPVVILEAVFLISLILALVLIRAGFPKSLFNFLHQLFWIALVCSLSNLLIEITNFDRLLVLLLSIVSLVAAWLYYKKVKKAPEGHIPYTQLTLIIFIALQFIAIVFNVTGRFSLAKIVTTAAVFNLWMLVSLYFIVQIIIQGLFLQFHTRKHENELVNLVDYTTVQKKFLGLLGTLATLLWVFFLLQNLNIDDWMRDYLTDALSQSRTIGGASFTFGGFVIFITVIWLSSVTSKIISYFYDVAGQEVGDISVQRKKNRASTLLIRMTVFTVGFLLAVAASDFPIDKLTIIFSAFGVGIGFGLQNIVNNLVSGLILAFEKPIQIGDTIEVNNRTGTIKEIGVRSSRLATSDGAEVIIPNGDLISQNVVNWTLSNNNRRVELLISVAYGTEIEKVRTVLTNLLQNRDDIMKKPAPSIFLNGITEKSVDFRVFFWADDLSNFLELRSRVLTDIYDGFNKEGIEMPPK